MSSLPPYTTREQILERLQEIFPEGTPNRPYLIRELAASTIFAMLYMGAVEGADIFLGPAHVYRMTVEQAATMDDQARQEYAKRVFPNTHTGTRWYADNTREPIRDESLREGLVQIGAVGSLKDVATTSGKPRYYLMNHFAALFDPKLSGAELKVAISDWQKNHLSKSALTRVSLAGLGAAANTEKVTITFPTGESRNISPGLSSTISKSVIEVFATSFLEHPVVLWLSTSADKVVAHDVKVAESIGLKIESDKNLPDIILADLGPHDPLIVFVEVVATDGPITDRRQAAIFEITDKAKFKREQIVFVTAYLDRGVAAFKKTVPNLAWNSFAWFVAEPDKIIILKDGTASLSKLLLINK